MSRCPTRFRTARYARRGAWAAEPDPRRRQVPVQCQTCGAWHLLPLDQPTNEMERP